MTTYELADGRIIVTYSADGLATDLCQNDTGMTVITELREEYITLPSETTYQPYDEVVKAGIERAAA